jgi:hypothetical protein
MLRLLSDLLNMKNVGGSKGVEKSQILKPSFFNHACFPSAKSGTFWIKS